MYNINGNNIQLQHEILETLKRSNRHESPLV